MGYDLDPPAIDPEDVDDVARGVLRHGDHDVGSQDRPRHDEPRAQGLTPGKPAGMAIDRQVVDGDDRWTSDPPQRERTGRAEVHVGTKPADGGGPPQVPADEARLGQKPVGRVGHVDEAARRTEHDESGVRPLDVHRVEDLCRVNADAGAWALETRPVDDDLESCLQLPARRGGRAA